MNFKWQWLLGSLFIIVFMSACASTPNYSTGQSALLLPRATDLVKLVQQRQLRFNSVSALTQVKLVKKGKTWSTTQGLLIENPYNLRMDMVNFFGQLTLQLSVVGSTLEVYVPAERTYYLGTPTLDNIQRFTGLPLPITDLVALLLEKLPPTVIEYAQVSSWEQGLVYTLDSGVDYRITIADGQVTEVVYTIAGQTIYQINYSMFDASNSYAHQMELQVPLDDIVVKLHFNDVEVNQQFSALQFVLTPPPGTIEKSLNYL
jgi:outer membrane lipoprotein-sorting protein